MRRRIKVTEKNNIDQDALQQLVMSSSPTPSHVSEDFALYSVNFFLKSYVLLPRSSENRRSFMDFLYPIYLKASPASPLIPALTAVASLLLEAWSLLKPDAPLSFSRTQYAKAMTSLRKSLQNPDKVGDDVLTASLLLDMYESVRSFLWSEPFQAAHKTGVIAMIEQRRQSPVSDMASQNLLLGARSQVVGRALETSSTLPPNIRSWISTAAEVPRTAGLELDELNIALADLQVSASRMGEPDVEIEEGLAWEVLHDLYELDQRYVTWASAVPEGWIVDSVAGPECIPLSIKECGLYQDHCHLYQSIFVAHTFNSHRASRIKLQLAILTCLSHMPMTLNGVASSAAQDTIQKLADDICASVPYHLGDRTGFKRIDDMTVQYPHMASESVASADHIVAAAAMGGWALAERLGGLLRLRVPLREGQRQWIAGQLRRIVAIYVTQPK